MNNASPLNCLVDGKHLSQEQSESFFKQVLQGEIDPALLASVLTALKIQGENSEEIAGAATAIRASATPFPKQALDQHDLITDCVGTGGDGANTINISTTAAILAAACGLKMAKHGNRSVSSMSGSADLLEALGVNLMMSPETASDCLSKNNLCFLFAPAYHSGFKHAAPVRKAMGIRTLFNILGPLVNPAHPKVMLLGVYTPDLLNVIAQALLLTGVKRAFVVHGSGLDEIALHGETQVVEINDGKLINRVISPEDFGLKNYSLDMIKGGTPQENADIVKAILSGNGKEAHNAAVIINCAALLYLHGKAKNLKAAAQIATTVLASGKALETLNQLVLLSNKSVDVQDNKITMDNILERIVIDKRIEIDILKKLKPLTSFIKKLKPTDKDMYAALKRTEDKPEAGFILECKKASPSKGLIRPDFDVKAICQIYDKYASAISVLTDEKYFQGNFDYLKTVTETVSCPVLNKDFFIDVYQVYLARYYGADAILLMLSVLTDDEYIELATVAKQYNLAILTEISNDEERDRALKLDAKMIGINNRNLRDLSTDISRTFDFAPTLPDNKIIISESGIYTNSQVRELAPAVDGFLVGSSLMAPENNPYQDIDLACRKLIYGNNKVCGLTAPKYAHAAAIAGARFGGLIFAEKSPRCITQDQALNIINTKAHLEYVGVFVNQKITEIVELADKLNLVAVQLHGTEDNAYIEELKFQLSKNKNAQNCQVWQAKTVNDTVPILSADVSHHILDGKSPGSGESFNWQVLNNSEQDLSKTFLAGGLNIKNINIALEQLNNEDLFGLDINSGVEISPGIKSSEKLNQVFSQIRNY